MPWDVLQVSEIRRAFVHRVQTLGHSVSESCRQFGVSRKTGYKWLKRSAESPQVQLCDRSRRPHLSPRITAPSVEDAVLEVRQQYGWGARKIHAFLRGKLPELPSVRTIHAILRRRGAVLAKPQDAARPQFFERGRPHELWQCDFKGPLEIARQKVHPFTVEDDHSRYLIALRAGTDLTMKTAFAVLWEAFGEFGLPESLLCDNAFGTAFEAPKTLSWFDAQLVRLGIAPIHGRPYHPQTQGKIERLHGTFEREVWPHVRRDCLEHFNEDINRWRCEVYNSIRPHEALGDQPPITRMRPSPRPRPDRVPDVEYPPGSVLRKVSTVGEIYWKSRRILAGYGLIGEYVRVEEQERCLAIHYGPRMIRTIAYDDIQGDKML